MILGFTCKEIAKNMNLSHRTVEEYLNSIKTKIGINSKRAITQHVLKNYYLNQNLCNFSSLLKIKKCSLENNDE